jgi:hypothetical protein
MPAPVGSSIDYGMTMAGLDGDCPLCVLALMQALVVQGPGRPEIKQVWRPVPGSGEVVLGVDHRGVCGTNIHIVTENFQPAKWPTFRPAV